MEQSSTLTGTITSLCSVYTVSLISVSLTLNPFLRFSFHREWSQFLCNVVSNIELVSLLFFSSYTLHSNLGNSASFSHSQVTRQLNTLDTCLLIFSFDWTISFPIIDFHWFRMPGNHKKRTSKNVECIHKVKV